MRMVKRLVLLSGLALLVLACEQRIIAPGACPEFCPNAEIRMLDSVLVGVVEQDTSFQGYIRASDAISMQVVGGGAAPESRVLLRFLRFGSVVGITNTVSVPVAELDSFRLDLLLTGRSPDVTGLVVTVYRLPVGIDTLSTLASVAPFFHDSLIVGVVVVPDTVSNDTVSTILPGAAFPTFVDDGRQMALGLAIRGTTPAFASFGTDEGVRGAGLRRFVKADSADGQRVPATDFRAVEFDTFVHPDPPPSPQEAGFPRPEARGPGIAAETRALPSSATIPFQKQPALIRNGGWLP